MRRPTRGFTLIELLIAGAIIAILAGFATISYTRYMDRANRTEAKSVISDLAGRMERQYTDTGTYTGYSIPDDLSTTPVGGNVTKYAISVRINDQTFTLSATPEGSQADDVCGTLTLDNAGRKTPSAATAGERCW